MNNETNKHNISVEYEANDGDRISVKTKVKKVVGGVAAAAVFGAASVGIAKMAEAPDPEGEQIVTVKPGDTVDGLNKEYVDGGANYTGLLREQVKNNPDNADVFENGQLDPGEEVELAERIG